MIYRKQNSCPRCGCRSKRIDYLDYEDHYIPVIVCNICKWQEEGEAFSELYHLLKKKKPDTSNKQKVLERLRNVL